MDNVMKLMLLNIKNLQFVNSRNWTSLFLVI